jgi:hypothetical protein
MARKREPAESHDPSSKKPKTEDVTIPHGEWRNQYDNVGVGQTISSAETRQTNGSGETLSNGSAETRQTNSSYDTQQTHGLGDSFESREALDGDDVDMNLISEVPSSERPSEKEMASVSMKTPTDRGGGFMRTDVWMDEAGDLSPFGVKAFLGLDTSFGVNTPSGVNTPVGVNHYVPATPEVVLQDFPDQTLGLKTPTEWLASWNAGADAGRDAHGMPPAPRRHPAAVSRIMGDVEDTRGIGDTCRVRKTLTWDIAGDARYTGEAGDAGDLINVGDTRTVRKVSCELTWDTPEYKGDVGKMGDACRVRDTLTWDMPEQAVELEDTGELRDMEDIGDTRDMGNKFKVRKKLTWDTSEDREDTGEMRDSGDAGYTRNLGETRKTRDTGSTEAMVDVASGAAETAPGGSDPLRTTQVEEMETAPPGYPSDGPRSPRPAPLWTAAWRESREAMRRLSNDESTVASAFSDTRNEAQYLNTCTKCVTFAGIHESREHGLCRGLKKTCRCDACGLAFWSSSDLTRHMQKAHPPKPYKCGLCGRPFATPNLLNLHYARH